MASRPDTSVIAATILAALSATLLTYIWLTVAHSGPVDEEGSVMYPLIGSKPRGGYPSRWPFWAAAHKRVRNLFPSAT